MKNTEDGALKNIGQRLKLWRKRRGMKASGLAGLIKISQSSLSEIQNGKSLPSAQTIKNLMKLEGMDIFWLLTGEESGDDGFLKGKEKVLRHLKELVENKEKGIEISRALESQLYQLVNPA